MQLSGAVFAAKPSIIVLGNGINHIFPPENFILEKDIIDLEGLIISEYEPNIPPSKNSFPERNRIISAISDGVLVIEADEKSGTSITVDFALEQGKNVYAIPGNITSRYSYGTNELIKQGAKPVTSIIDILEDF